MSGETILDRVVAVVNNQVILESDLELETRIFHLLPIGDAADYTAPKALERLITRALIEQQIVLEDPHGMEVDAQQVEESLKELRQSLPACKRRDCESANGWQTYLLTLGLTPDRVQSYWSDRMAILRFIEQRFRSGIRISPEEIEKYYRNDLLPRYAKPSDAPALQKLSPRIQEILLQQQVNALMNDWLKSLQSQGQVEVLDASLRGSVTAAPTKVDSSVSGSASDPASSSSSGPAIPAHSLPATVPPSSVASPAAPSSNPPSSPSSNSKAPPGKGGAR